MKLPEFHGIQILLVEDEPFIRSTLKRMLRPLGNPEVREASDGSEGLSLLRFGYVPALILCDVQMQPMDGLTFMRAVRALPDRASAAIPAIMLTAASDQETVLAVSGLGHAGYLLKPVSPKLLADRMEAMFVRRSA